MTNDKNEERRLRLAAERAERGRCAACGETWPCTVRNHPAAYTPMIVAQHVWTPVGRDEVRS
jgi:hypothetical protein